MASWSLKSISPFTNSNNNSKSRGFGSTRLFALKESRWFTRDEFNLFQNVSEPGYILELRLKTDQDQCHVRKDMEATSKYGIVLWTNKIADEKNEAILVHLADQKGKSKKPSWVAQYSSLRSFWSDNMEIRIHNMNDGQKNPDCPEKIRQRIERAIENSYKWHDSLHFVRWCRYGNPTPIEENNKKRQLSHAAVRWGSISASAGALFYVTKCQQLRSAKRG